MLSKNRPGKKFPGCGKIVGFLIFTLLIFLMPPVVNQLGWVADSSVVVAAKEDKDKDKEDKDKDKDKGDEVSDTEETELEKSGVPYHTPANAQADVLPRSMLVMSNDHQLFFKAYTDWSDIDGDGTIDDTYKKGIRYYGYFDSDFCYDYKKYKSKGKKKKNKDAEIGDVFSISEEANSDYTCKGKRWSGNFLNWVSMTRMDVLRKVLYGGKRYLDNENDTTLLERAYLPYDAHSFVKVVEDKDVIENNTPFKVKKDDKDKDKDNDDHYESISFCNTTGYTGNGQSKSVNEPPLLKVAEGRWPNWAANERWQCVWRGERGVGSDRPEKGKKNSEYQVIVEVCADSNEENCRNYPESEAAKPTGLLHEYANSIDFGLFSGSYAKNLSGGVLRANLESFNREVDSASGAFRDDVAGIVSNIDAFRVSRYSYSDGTYNSDSCPFGKRLNQIGGGDCSSWGNPFAEMTEEALRYLTGAPAPTDAFDVGTSSNAQDYVEGAFVDGLTSPAWNNDSEATWCAAHSMILVNASEVSFDSNQLGSLDLRDGGDISSWTNRVAAAEKVSGKYFVGEAGGNSDKLCTPKSVNELSSVKGICPGAPGLEGSYQVAGLAKYAHDTSLVRNADDSQGSNVSTYAVRLSANTPIIDLGRVKIVPACENVTDTSKCAMVDFRPKSIGNNEGSFDISWEVAEFGGDYDSDIEMSFDYALHGDRLTVTTDVISQSSSRRTGVGYILSGTSGRYKTVDGNVLASETSDGFVVHSGINNYSGSLCNNCQVNNPPTTQSYRVSQAAGAATLKPPLYYAAKYGNGVPQDPPSAYFEVNRVDQLADTLREVLDQVLRSSNQTGSGLGYSSNVENLVFQTLYNNRNSWSGDLIALKTSSSGIDSVALWSARNQLPAADKRTIITSYNDQGIPFNVGNSNSLKQVAAYLRGSPDEEERNGGNFRNRLWLDNSAASLGDIIDSQPFVVGKPDSYYVPSDEKDISYLQFQTQFVNRTPMVYVGANDGMLHGFDANTGVERIAYVPGSFLFEPIQELAEPSYDHRFYVDGSPTVLDARLSENGTGDGEWRSILASGLGAGGRGLFALDVTQPANFSEQNADKIALFEYAPSDEGDLFGSSNATQHLGYVYGRPSIAQLENGKYAVVFGNGYFSPSGKAALYIIYLDDVVDGNFSSGDVLRLVPDDAANAGENGLSTVSLVDRDRNGRMDAAYGGDLQGNLWRFDLSGGEPAWPDAITRLFSATQGGARQVISTAVEVGNHPEKGLMVFFGTGSTPGRVVPTSELRGATDAFYAVHDTFDLPSGSYPLTPTDLTQRVLKSEETTDTQGNAVTLRYFVNSNDANINGWYMAFPENERVVDAPVLHGTHILLTTLIPGRGLCGAEDGGFLYELSAFDGQAPNNPALDVNGDGLLNAQDKASGGGAGNGDDVVPVGMRTQGALFTPVVDTNLEQNTENKLTVNTAADTRTYQGKPLNPLSLGRVSWRELEH